MLQENIKFIIPFIIQNRSIVNEKILTNAKIKKVGYSTFLELMFRPVSIKQSRWLFYELQKEPYFYCGSGIDAKFLIPLNKQLLVNTVSTCGIVALSKSELLQYFRFWSCTKVLNEKSLAARESSQALFFLLIILFHYFVDIVSIFCIRTK